jgi:hypothetical protein
MSDTESVALSISTAPPKRERISIDGVVYELATVDDLELRESLRLADAGRKIGKHVRGEYSEEGAEQMQALLDQVSRRVVIGLTDEVFGKLRHSHKLAIVQAFSDAAGWAGGPQQTETSPPDSSASTADLPATG